NETDCLLLEKIREGRFRPDASQMQNAEEECGMLGGGARRDLSGETRDGHPCTRLHSWTLPYSNSDLSSYPKSRIPLLHPASGRSPASRIPPRIPHPRTCLNR